MVFDITRKLDLSDQGETWKDCYISFRPITVREAEMFTNLGKGAEKDPLASTQKILEVLKGKFVEGFAMENGVRTAMKKDDLDDLPIDLLTKAIQLFGGGLDKKKLTSSTTPSEAKQE